MNQEKFSFFIPIEIEKSSKTGEERYANMKFKGIASSMNYGKDKQGQNLNPAGFDISDLNAGAQVNWHHLWKDKPSAIIGESIKASITKNNELYIEGKLYEHSKLAREVYDLAEVLEKSSTNKRLGFSVEGLPLEKDPLDENNILRAKISGMAITPAPICPGTKMELMKGGLDELQFEQQLGSEFLIDIVDDNGVRITVDKNLEIVKGGEGSRGGKVIGHTESGKPIYADKNASHEDYKDFTYQDHKEATNLHFKKMQRSYKNHNSKVGAFGTRTDKSNHHEEMAHSHMEANGYKIKSHLEKSMTTGSGPGGAEYIEKDVKKAMMAGETTGRDTTNKTSTQETLKEEDVEGSKKKKKKKDDEKEFFTKGEIHIRNFSRFNLDADSSKSFYTIAEKIQRQLTPNMEVTKISKEAIEKAEQLLGLGQPVAAATESAEEIAKKTAELQKAQENKALQKELEETLEKAEKLKLKIEGKPEAATTITASSATTVTAPISNPEFEKAVNDKIGALGILIQAKGEENIELKKAVDNLLKFNEILGKKIGIIESQPLDRKSVSTSAYIEKAGEQTAPGANGVKTYSMSNKKHRAAVADVLFKASLNPDGTGVKDEEFAKACSYIELGSFPNQSQASRIQARLLEECKIKLVQ